MAFYAGRDGRARYDLQQVLKSGGEGTVYLINGRPGSVAKLYKPEILADVNRRNTTRDKILAMLDMNFDPYFNGNLMVAWPEDILYNNVGEFQGYVMPKIENMKSLIWAIRPTDRDVLWPKGYRWSFSVAMAYNLAVCIEVIHRAGIIVGDLNTNNILISATGNVTLIDSGSFNIRSRGGRIYKCVVGFPEVLPAELQGKDLTRPENQFTEKTDCFSLAIHIFNLLCNNCHPFGVLSYNQAHGSTSSPKIVDNIIRGNCPYVRNPSAQTVADALDMNVFPQELRELFKRAFGYDMVSAVKPSTIANRPTAQEWRMTLGKMYEEGVQTCAKNPLHEYPVSYRGGCPWCAIENRRQRLSDPAQPRPITISASSTKPSPARTTSTRSTTSGTTSARPAASSARTPAAPANPTPPAPAQGTRAAAKPKKEGTSFFGALFRLFLFVSFVILILYLNDDRGMEFPEFYEYCINEAVSFIGSLF